MLNKVQSFNLSLFNPVLIFVFSILACLFVLLVERYAGIGWDFHPDSNTYLTISKGVATDNFNFQFLLGGSFYLVVDLLGSEIWKILTFNIILYSLTNVALANFYYKNIHSFNSVALILFLIVIFNPYRTHLAVYVLKDTLIIFGLVLFFTSKKLYSWIFILVSFSATIRSIIYLVALINRRNLFFVLAPVLIFILIQPDGFLYAALSTQDQVDMTFRSFDKVPNFYEYGILGAAIRSIIWPFIFLTGLFFFISPTIMYLPIAFGSFALQFWHLLYFRKLALFLPIYLSMSILAYLVSGFTSFIRYALPIFTILPILAIKSNNKNFKSNHKGKNNDR